jgi:hypothetical protein
MEIHIEESEPEENNDDPKFGKVSLDVADLLNTQGSEYEQRGNF